jgi:gas vesicle protein
MSEHNDNFGAFLAGLLLGGLAGGITALLFAPQSGEETRTIIRDKAIELRDQANETLEETMSRAEKAANSAVKQAESVYNQAKAKATEVAKKSQVILDEQKEKLGGKKPKEDKA